MLKKILKRVFAGDMITKLRQEGWAIVSPDEAYADTSLNRVPDTLMASQGRVAALAIDAGLDNRTLTHLAIEETEIGIAAASRQSVTHLA